ncbi:MAG: GNAT family N-acetyltransferase [Anaerolineales bacterium]|nr:GNAT family N-acetyltransferase [Anaerolineales bacterium]
MSLDYTWRAATIADLPNIHALLEAVGQADDDPRVPSLANLEREFEDEWSPAETDTQLVLAPDGAAVAYARLYTNPRPTEAARTYLDADVHPAQRGTSLEDALLDWVEQRASRRLAEVCAASGFTGLRLLRGRANMALAHEVTRLKRRAFQPVRYFYRMRRDLREPIPDLPQPAGLRLTTFAPELSEALRQADNEAFSDHWQHEEISEHDWRAFFVESSTFRPDLTFVLFDGDQIAAFSFNRVDPEENARQGYTTGWINSLGTRRPWRKRGLASFLITHSFRAFQAAGLDYATLGVDAENPSGALGLYEGLGFVSFRRHAAFDKELA